MAAMAVSAQSLLAAAGAMDPKSLDFGFGGSTADEVLGAMQKFRAEVLPLV